MKKTPGAWPLREIVEVEWNDSITNQTGWTALGDHKTGTCGPLRTIGYLVTHNRDVIEVAQSQSSVTQHFADLMTIPIGAIRKVRRIRTRRSR